MGVGILVLLALVGAALLNSPLTSASLLAGGALAGILAAVAFVCWARLRYGPVVQNSVGFFHPFADGGGGGERVLWAGIQALQTARPEVRIQLYYGGPLTVEELASQAERLFALAVAPTFSVVRLSDREALSPSRYPRLTAARQAVASVRLASEALTAAPPPRAWADTTGWAFAYPLVRAAGCRVLAYVHYPTVSSDMARRACREAAAAVRAELWGAGAEGASGGERLFPPGRLPGLVRALCLALRGAAKLVYYALLAALYALSGRCATAALANSSWTAAHLRRTWCLGPAPRRVFPPCDVRALAALPLDRPLKRLFLLSVAQFRPEKEQLELLEAFALVCSAAGGRESALEEARLVFVGGCRDAGDRARADALESRASELGLGARVEVVRDASHDRLLGLMRGAVAGLHAMREEHFGITCVDYMAAGVLPIVHDSGGPALDVVVPARGDRQRAQLPGAGVGSSPEALALALREPVGFRCSSREEYARAMGEALAMPQADRLRMAAAGRRRAVDLFSTETFAELFVACVGEVLGR